MMLQRHLLALGTVGLVVSVASLAGALPAEPAKPIPPPVVAPGSAPSARAPIVLPAAVPCVVQHSGAVTAGSRPCTIVVTWDSAAKTGGISLKSTSGAGPGITPDAKFKLQNPPVLGPLPAPMVYAISYVDGLPGQGTLPMWVASSGATGLQTQGTATLTITSVAPGATSGSVQEYQLHGTLDATLPPMRGAQATGSVTLHATF